MGILVLLSVALEIYLAGLIAGRSRVVDLKKLLSSNARSIYADCVYRDGLCQFLLFLLNQSFKKMMGEVH